MTVYMFVQLVLVLVTQTRCLPLGSSEDVNREISTTLHRRKFVSYKFVQLKSKSLRLQNIAA